MLRAQGLAFGLRRSHLDTVNSLVLIHSRCRKTVESFVTQLLAEWVRSISWPELTAVAEKRVSFLAPVSSVFCTMLPLFGPPC